MAYDNVKRFTAIGRRYLFYLFIYKLRTQCHTIIAETSISHASLAMLTDNLFLQINLMMTTTIM